MWCLSGGGFGLHSHDHAWHMYLYGALVAGYNYIPCGALVAGIICGWLMLGACIHTHMYVVKVY